MNPSDQIAFAQAAARVGTDYAESGAEAYEKGDFSEANLHMQIGRAFMVFAKAIAES